MLYKIYYLRIVIFDYNGLSGKPFIAMEFAF